MIGWLRAIGSRISAIWRGAGSDQQLDDEMQFHVEMLAERNVARGMRPDEARRQALLAFGGMEQAREEYRDRLLVRAARDFAGDIRFALRQLRRAPAFAVAAILTLALGIGANTAIFSVVSAVLFRPLPFPQPDHIVVVGGLRFLARLASSPDDPLLWRNHVGSLSGAAGYQTGEVNLSGSGDPERVQAAQVEGDFFQVLGVPAARGRTLPAGQTTPGAVISWSLWERRYGADPAIAGKTIVLNGRLLTVLGVMPARFQFPKDVEIWMPRGTGDDTILRGVKYSNVIARVKPDVTLDQAHAEMSSIAGRLREQYPDLKKDKSGIELTALQESLAGKSRKELLMLLVGVGFVLLIACTNVANLVLARGADRAREFAMRAALGARRARLVRQLLAESALLSGAGALLGVLFAHSGLPLLVSLLARDVPTVNRVELDGRVLLFTASLAIAAGVFAALVPALFSLRLRPMEALKQSPQAGAGRPRSRIRAALVVCEVAVACTLLLGTGLMVRSLWNVLAIDPGFRTQGVVKLDMALPSSRYKPAQASQYFEQAITRIQRLPGVLSAGAVSSLPLSGTPRAGFLTRAEGQAPLPFERSMAEYRVSTPGYFEAMGIPLRRGRFFTEADAAGAPKVAIVNEQMARRFWSSLDVAGKRFVAFGSTYEVVGVVGGVRYSGLTKPPNEAFYAPAAQSPSGFMTVVVRSTIAPRKLIPAVRAELAAIDRDQPISKVATLEELVSSSISFRPGTFLLGLFGGLALLLTAVGIYALIAYSVAQRTHEIGVRTALGARRSDVLWLVMRQAMALVAVGVAIGLAGGVALTRTMRSLLFEVQPNDAPTFVAVCLLLGGAGLLACAVPARRAVSVEPVIALRAE